MSHVLSHYLLAFWQCLVEESNRANYWLVKKIFVMIVFFRNHDNYFCKVVFNIFVLFPILKKLSHCYTRQDYLQVIKIHQSKSWHKFIFLRIMKLHFVLYVNCLNLWLYLICIKKKWDFKAAQTIVKLKSKPFYTVHVYIEWDSYKAWF